MAGLVEAKGRRALASWLFACCATVFATVVVGGITRLSHFRLTAHLGLAFLICTALLWLALDLLRPAEAAGETGASPGMRRFAAGLAFLTFVMILSGGLVAGLHAGVLYNTFPLMDGYVVRRWRSPGGRCCAIWSPTWRQCSSITA